MKYKENIIEYIKTLNGVSYGSRTRIIALKGRCPEPLDEKDLITLIIV